LTLRPWTPSDVNVLIEIFDDDDVSFRTPLPSPFTRLDAETYLRTRDGYCDYLILSGDGAPVGQVMLNTSSHMVSYMVARHARGQGYASRALALLCGQVREWGVRSVGLEIEPDNVASVRVAQRCAFRRTGEAPEEVTDKGRTYRLETWRLSV